MRAHKKREGRNEGYSTSATTAVGERMRQARGTEDVCKPISKQMGPGVAWTRRGLLASKVRNVRMNQGLPTAEHGHTYKNTRTLRTYWHTRYTPSDSQRTYFPLLLFFFGPWVTRLHCAKPNRALRKTLLSFPSQRRRTSPTMHFTSFAGYDEPSLRISMQLLLKD